MFDDPFKRTFARMDLVVPTAIDPWTLLGGSTTPVDTIPGSLATSGKMDDVIWTTEAVICLVSDRLVEWMIEKQVTGWRLFPLDLAPKSFEGMTYHGLTVTGRSGAVEYWRPADASERDDWRIRIAQSGWDGSDFFLAAGTAYVFATEKVHHLVAQNRIQNVEMTRIDDVRIADVVKRRAKQARG